MIKKIDIYYAIRFYRIIYIEQHVCISVYVYINMEIEEVDRVPFFVRVFSKS